MKVQFDFNKCILCLKNPANSWEHIIPECIGGKLQIKLLCKGCNNFFGTELIGKIPKVPSFKLAIIHLKNEIPDIFKNFEKHLVYIQEDTCGLLRLKRKGPKLKVLAEKKDDNTFIMDIEDALKYIPKMMEKDGLAENEISEKMKLLQESENYKVIELSKKLKAEKGTGKPTQISLKGPEMDNRVIVLIAYEFLSSFIGTLIYNPNFALRLKLMNI